MSSPTSATVPRRSARLAAGEAAKAAKAAEPVPVKAAKKKSMTREERYEHLVATDPMWTAYDAKRTSDKDLREAYKAGAWATPQLLAIDEVVKGVAALKARIAAAKTVEEFDACAAIADKELYEKADAFEWRDPMAMFFLTDCRTYLWEASRWIKWAEANRAQAVDFIRAVKREKAGDYSGESSYKLSPTHLNLMTESPVAAKKNAIRVLTYFEGGMF
jgi:hypothetical protein